MTYADFIEEIRLLIPEANAANRHNHEAREFRDWRYQVESMVTSAQRQGFTLPGEFKSRIRQYRSMRTNASASDNRKAFDQDMGDSLTELRFLVDHFDKFGAPDVSSGGSPQQLPLIAPDKMTLHWLWHNVPIGIWGMLAGALGVAFSIGFALGQSEPGRKFVVFFVGLFPH